MNEQRVTIVGAGLAGSLMAVYLGRAGYRVDVFERRPDPRSGAVSRGRSINLALSVRGIEALRGVGAADEVLASAVPMHGRMIHDPAGKLSFQRYGTEPDQFINSVSRAVLNRVLVERAEAFPNVHVHFDRKCVEIDLETGAARFESSATGERFSSEPAMVIGTDGVFSAVRGAMQRLDRFDFSQTYLEHGYKELCIPPAADGSFRAEKNALHIWPRRSFMMIALPNQDGSFTCTLFWPFEGAKSFAALRSATDVRTFFEREFPDAIPLLPTLAEDYFVNPTSSLATVRCAPWFVGDRVVLVGDACHAVVPFYGQGMNAAFEDVLVLAECLEKHGLDRHAAFASYFERRKENVDALADLAIANFIEMRDHTGSRMFLLKKKSEHLLHRLFPRWYVPLYTMVTFTRMGYAAAWRRAKRQNQTVLWILAALVMVVLC